MAGQPRYLLMKLMPSPSLVLRDLDRKNHNIWFTNIGIFCFTAWGRFCSIVFENLVPFRFRITFVATQQTTAEEPRSSARFDTICHSIKQRGVAGKIEASDWRRRLWSFRWGDLVKMSEQIYYYLMKII